MRFRHYSDARGTPPISVNAFVEVIYKGDTGEISKAQAGDVDWRNVEVWRHDSVNIDLIHKRHLHSSAR